MLESDRSVEGEGLVRNLTPLDLGIGNETGPGGVPVAVEFAWTLNLK